MFRTALGTPFAFAGICLFNGVELPHLWQAAVLSAVLAVLEPLGDDLWRRWRGAPRSG